MLSYSTFIQAEKLSQQLENAECELLSRRKEYIYESDKNRFRNSRTGEYFSAEPGKIDLPNGRTIQIKTIGKRLEQI
jgi:hypothetical protein